MNEGCESNINKTYNLKQNEYLIYASDILSSPNKLQFFRKKNAFPHMHASRALPIAGERDLVVLGGPLNRAYHQWLLSNQLSTENVHSYGFDETDFSIAELIIQNPDPVRDMIKNKKGTPVYLPFYGSQTDQEAAGLLDANYFGCDESVTLKYFDKLSFKDVCSNLDIEVVPGESHQLEVPSVLNYFELANIVSDMLTDYQKVIIRGSVGSAGRSLYEVEDVDLEDLYEELIKNNDEKLLVEPLLNVISSPNDQWVINREGEIHHLGLTAQLFQGFKHAGNISGQYFSERIQKYIFNTSAKIVQEMANVGYRGVLGIDYIISDQGIFPIENNARMNGSSYAYALAEKVCTHVGTVKCWKFYKAQTIPCSFEDLHEKLNRVIYDQKRVNSVFPFDCDLLGLTGKFTVLIFAEDMYHIDYLQDALSQMGILRA